MSASGIVSPEAAEQMREPGDAAPEDIIGFYGDAPRLGVARSNEHVASLEGAKFHGVAQQMMRSSAAVATAIGEVESMLLAAEWDCEGGRDDIADYIREALGLGDRDTAQVEGTIEGIVRDLLYAMHTGCGYYEEVWRPDGGRVWLHRLERRDPRAHYQWVTDYRGDLAGVTQHVTDSAGRLHRVTIPISRLCLAVWGRQGGDPWGRGLLRPLWSHWRDQQHALQMMAVAVERAAVPPVHVQYEDAEMRQVVDASGSRVFSEEAIAALKAAIRQQVRAMVSVGGGYIETPSERYVRISPMQAPRVEHEMFAAVVELHEHRMTRAYMAQVLDLGITSTGSRAVGEVHERAAERFSVNALEWVRQTLRPTIERAVRYNFGEVPADDIPRLTWSGVEVPAFVRRVEALPGLAGAGLLAPTEDVVRAVHRHLGLPVPEPGEASPGVAALRRRVTAGELLRRGE